MDDGPTQKCAKTKIITKKSLICHNHSVYHPKQILHFPQSTQLISFDMNRTWQQDRCNGVQHAGKNQPAPREQKNVGFHAISFDNQNNYTVYKMFETVHRWQFSRFLLLGKQLLYMHAPVHRCQAKHRQNTG